ncbi:MAG: hypothetical protein P9X24_16075 [Candidatus Hatepunaea meridiana]|nr:hypothetical protein [Candidatus Hatepunaea meridiana]
MKPIWLKLLIILILLASVNTLFTGCGSPYDKELFGKWKAVQMKSEEDGLGKIPPGEEIELIIEEKGLGTLIRFDAEEAFKWKSNVRGFHINLGDLRWSYHRYTVNGDSMIMKFEDKKEFTFIRVSKHPY